MICRFVQYLLVASTIVAKVQILRPMAQILRSDLLGMARFSPFHPCPYPSLYRTFSINQIQRRLLQILPWDPTNQPLDQALARAILPAQALDQIQSTCHSHRLVHLELKKTHPNHSVYRHSRQAILGAVSLYVYLVGTVD